MEYLFPFRNLNYGGTRESEIWIICLLRGLIGIAHLGVESMTGLIFLKVFITAQNLELAEELFMWTCSPTSKNMMLEMTTSAGQK